MVRVLVVDDEPQVARALARTLRRLGYEVELAADGQSALGLLDQFAPEVVISDFQMPQMSGGELLERVKERMPGVGRLLISGYANLAESGPPPGAVQEVVSKPWETEQLVGAIRRSQSGAAGVARGAP